MAITVRRRKLKNGELSLYLDIYHQGKRWYETLDLRLTGDKEFDKEAKRLAEIAKNQRSITIIGDQRGIVSQFKGNVSFADYADHCVVGIAPRSPKACAARFIREFFQNTPLKNLMLADVEAFQKFLQNKKNWFTKNPLSANTVESYMNGTMAILNQAVREKYLQENPGKGIVRVKGKESMRYPLTTEEIQRLAKARIMGEKGKGKILKRAFLFSCMTGLRHSDILKLTWGMIRNRQIEMVQKKIGTPLYIPINETAWKLIDPGHRIPPHDEFIFPDISKLNLWEYFRPWAKRAGLSIPLSFHYARYTAGTRLMEMGVDPFTVMRLLDHKNIKTTMIYAKSRDQMRIEAVKRIEVDLDLKVANAN